MHRIGNIIKHFEEAQVACISIDDSFKYAKIANYLISQNEEVGYKLVINVLNNWGKIPESTRELWTDLIELAGFYPYIDKNIEKVSLKNFPAELRKEKHLSKHINSKYFHEEQFQLLNFLASDKNVIVSAPTSFGKSLLIEEIVASFNYSNIVIIQPTLALLDETRQKLLKYQNNYKLIIRTTQEPSTDKANIYLFTAERVNEYKYFVNVDFLIIDEFYKLSGIRDDERSASLNNAFYILHEKFNPKFYLLGPNIDDISKGFKEKYNAEFFKTSYSLVDTRVFNIYEEYPDEFGQKGKKKEFKESILFELLYKLKEEQTIIYCSSPARVRYLAKEFSYLLKDKGSSESKLYFPLIEWIEENISTRWNLINNLKYEIGIHDGALQKHITSTIIDYFNEGKLKYLFCTSTIIEGVNTSAKNIVYFDSKKGPSEVDFFDYSNIKGRAGRMMEHYVGNIYNFNTPPPKKEDVIIDIPFYQQNPIKDETLIQLKEKDVKNKTNEQFKKIQQIPSKDKEIIKLNGVSVDGQSQILSILRQNLKNVHNLVVWTGYPSYEQLKYVLNLAWDNLIISGETTRPMTCKKLVYMTFNYGTERNVSKFVNETFKYKKQNKKEIETDDDLLNEAIQEIFQMLKHWFQYKVPKWLSVVSSLQELVCLENNLKSGNYQFYANALENDFLSENLTILLEYGIPTSAIRKLEKLIPSNIEQDDILKFIKEKNLHNKEGLLTYEKDKIIRNLR